MEPNQRKTNEAEGECYETSQVIHGLLQQQQQQK